MPRRGRDFHHVVSGILSAFERQINAWVDRWVQFSRRQTLAVEFVAHRANRNPKEPPTITVRAAPEAPIELAYGRERILYVDPASGKVVGEASRSTRGLFASVERIHRFRGALRGRARDWNWHNRIGFWSAIPLFFIVLSGVIMSYGWANNLLY